MKRYIATLLIAVLCVPLLYLTASAEEETGLEISNVAESETETVEDVLAEMEGETEETENPPPADEIPDNGGEYEPITQTEIMYIETMDTETVSLIACMFGIVSGALFGLAFMTQWKPGA